MKTISAKAQDEQSKWILVDAEGLVLGRLASQIAIWLRGKHKSNFTPHVDLGDYVIVTNSSKIKVTGKKLTDKMYYRHSGWVGGLKATSYRDCLKKDATLPLRKAVTGMLPKNKLQAVCLNKLKIFAGPEHDHIAQKPTLVKLI